ncbi:MAG: O-antigen ligase family protein [Gammaproteobacteria bacterium]
MIKLVALISSIGIAVCFAAPIVALVIYAIARPLLTPAAFAGVTLFGVPITTPFSMAILAVGMWNLFLQRSWGLIGSHSLMLNGMLVCAAFSVAQSVAKGASMVGMIKLMTGWMIFVIAYNGVRKEEDALTLYKAIALSSVIPICYGFYQAIMDVVWRGGLERVSSVMGTNNAYGIYLSMALVATTLVVMRADTRRGRLLYSCVLVAIVVSQVLAQNRGTWIALTLAALAATLRYRHKIQVRYVVYVALFIFVFFSGIIASRFEQLAEKRPYARYENTLVARIEYWKAIAPVIAERPLLGYGVGTASIVTQKYLGSSSPPHNDYVRLSLEVGVFGALCYALFLLQIMLYFWFRRVRDEVWKANFAMIMLSIYLPVITMFQNIAYNLVNFPFFLILVGAAIKLNQLAAPKQEAPKPLVAPISPVSPVSPVPPAGARHKVKSTNTRPTTLGPRGAGR